MIPEMMPNEYIAMYAKENTRYQKQFALRRFLKVYLGHDVSDLNPAMQEYLQRDDKQVVQDLVGYHTHPSIHQLAPKTKSLYTSLVITYFEDCCDLRLSNLQRKIARKSMAEKVRAVTVNANPTREMIRTILQHCNERHTAEILISASSGLRFGEILQLEHGDIDYTTSPVTIHVRGETTKTGDPRTTYLSAEAVDAVKSYYRVRDAMIKIRDHHNRRPQPESDMDDKLVFPWSQTNEGALILRSIKNAGYTERDKRTGRYRVHFHILRAFFLTQAKRRAGVPFVEAWAGHAGYLASSYHKPSVEEDQDEYLKCEPDITINIPDDYLKIKQEQNEQIASLQQTNTHLAAQLTVLRMAVEDMQREQERITLAQISGLPRRLPYDDPDVSDV